MGMVSAMRKAIINGSTVENVIVADDEYVYAKSVRPVRTSHSTFTPPSGLAVAV